MRAKSREITYWNDSETVYTQRKSFWKDKITTIQTYVFSKDSNIVTIINKDAKDLGIRGLFSVRWVIGWLIPLFCFTSLLLGTIFAWIDCVVFTDNDRDSPPVSR